MRAIVYDRYGPAEVLRLAELAKPVPGPGDVLVRIHATVATPPDVAQRSARPFIVRFFSGLVRPKTKVLGGDFAGVVEAVGRDVRRFRPGDRVYGASLAMGAYADYIRIAETDALAIAPGNCTMGEAAGMAEGFLTALPFLRDEARIAAGHKVLVNGASGSVGSIGVQLARHFGAEVTGVCSTANVEMVAALGAHRVIDYTRQDFTREAERYDIVFDAVGKSTFSRCEPILAPRGVYLTTVPSLAIAWDMLRTARSGGRRAVLATTGLRPSADKARDLDLLRDLAEAGAVRAVVERSYRLEDIADAHRHVETGRKKGSVVVLVHDETAGESA